jgi:hypothetical protein
MEPIRLQRFYRRGGRFIMAQSDYLRRQAQLLKGWANTCPDLHTAERLRSKAAEFERRADSVEDEESILPAFMHRGSDRDGSDTDRD